MCKEHKIIVTYNPCAFPNLYCGGSKMTLKSYLCDSQVMVLKCSLTAEIVSVIRMYMQNIGALFFITFIMKIVPNLSYLILNV